QALWFDATGELLMQGTDRRLHAPFTSSPRPKPIEGSTIGGTVSPIAEAFKRLDAIKNLPFNWDSYGSAPPSNATVDAASNLIWKAYLVSLYGSGGKPAVPYVVLPLSGGGVHVAWRGVAGASGTGRRSEGIFGSWLPKATG